MKREVIEPDEKTYLLKSERDLKKICVFSRTITAQIGFKKEDRDMISTVLHEIGNNVLKHADHGTVTVKYQEGKGILFMVKDSGPGIPNVDKALKEGYSTGQGLGVGLPGAKRLMDDFEIQTTPGKGTTVKMCKWLTPSRVF